ncbi:hypothetical protein L218DRAFT_950108 [Marasmius fiardii PR-910]|nr:hypothetical protein L218DRAFT_950108 [Marasmius fiardii PR-910]
MNTFLMFPDSDCIYCLPNDLLYNIQLLTPLNGFNPGSASVWSQLPILLHLSPHVLNKYLAGELHREIWAANVPSSVDMVTEDWTIADSSSDEGDQLINRKFLAPDSPSCKTAIGEKKNMSDIDDLFHLLASVNTCKREHSHFTIRYFEMVARRIGVISAQDTPYQPPEVEE